MKLPFYLHSLILAFIAVFVVGCLTASAERSSGTYRSAVVEYNPIKAKNPYEVLTKREAQEIMLTNLANYEVRAF